MNACPLTVALNSTRRTGRWRQASALALLVALGGPFALAAPAQAADAPVQTAPAGSTQLEEITVTARYRSENLQKTPIAITALNGDQQRQGRRPPPAPGPARGVQCNGKRTSVHGSSP